MDPITIPQDDDLLDKARLLSGLESVGETASTLMPGTADPQASQQRAPATPLAPLSPQPIEPFKSGGDDSLLTDTPLQSGSELEKARTRSRTECDGHPNFRGYRIVRELGKGTYGRVWLAETDRTSSQVAIKEFLNVRHDDLRAVEAEIKQLGSLANDPGIVRIIDTNLEYDPPYFVMQFCERGPTCDHVPPHGMPAERALRLFRQVVQAMAYVHAAGIIHCDLKPSNILVDNLDKPWIIDFGQARHLGSSSHGALGTYFYMGPDQVSGQGARGDTRWDVYALGATLHYWLTGRAPHKTPEFTAQLEAQTSLLQQLELYKRHLEASPLPTDCRAMAGVDSLLAEILDKCLEKDPDRRYSSAGHIAAALERRDEKLRTRENFFPTDRSTLPAEFAPLQAGPLPVDKAVEAFRLALNALTGPHGKGIVHGHLHVGHLLFDGDKACVIGDWDERPTLPSADNAASAIPDTFETLFPQQTNPTTEASPPPDPSAVDTPASAAAPTESAQAAKTASPAGERPPGSRSSVVRQGVAFLAVLMAPIAQVMKNATIVMFRRETLDLEDCSPARCGPSSEPRYDLPFLGQILKDWLLGPPDSPHRATFCRATFFGRTAFHYIAIPTPNGRTRRRVIDVYLWTLLTGCLSPESKHGSKKADDVQQVMAWRKSRLRQAGIFRTFLIMALVAFLVVATVVGYGLSVFAHTARAEMYKPLHSSATIAAKFFAQNVSENTLLPTKRFIEEHSKDDALRRELRNIGGNLDRLGKSVFDPSVKTKFLASAGGISERLEQLAAEERFKWTGLNGLFVLDAKGRFLGSYYAKLKVPLAQDPILFFRDFSGRAYFNGESSEEKQINRPLAFDATDPRPLRPLSKMYVSAPFSSFGVSSGMNLSLSTPIVDGQDVIGVFLATWDIPSFRAELNRDGLALQGDLTGNGASRDRPEIDPTLRADFALFSPNPSGQNHNLLIFDKADGHKNRIDEATKGNNWNDTSEWHRIEIDEVDGVDYATDTLFPGRRSVVGIADVKFDMRDPKGETVWKVAVMLPEHLVNESVNPIITKLKIFFWTVIGLCVVGFAVASLFLLLRIRKIERSLYA